MKRYKPNARILGRDTAEAMIENEDVKQEIEQRVGQICYEEVDEDYFELNTDEQQEAIEACKIRFLDELRHDL